MPILTTKELKAIGEELHAEEILLQKYKYYAEVTKDPTIRALCENLAGTHINHFDTLLQNLSV